MTNGDKMYDLVCKDRFDELSTDVKKILTILEGRNGDEGLCEKVRANSKFNKIIMGATTVITVIILTQFIHWIFRQI